VSETFTFAYNTEATAMSDSKNPTRYNGVESGTIGPRDVYKTGGRHAAITNNLYNWHSYKNWAEKARGNFDEKK
jgi:hypothetical protein